MQIGGGQFRKKISASTPLVPKSYMLDQIFGEKNEQTQFLGQNLTFLQGLSLAKYKEIFKKFLYDQTS